MIGPRIAKLRQAAGLSQADLARRVNISPSAIGMYEQGRREPAGDILIALARELHVSTDFLLTGIPDTPSVPFFPQEQLPGLCLGASFSRQELAVLLAALLIES